MAVAEHQVMDAPLTSVCFGPSRGLPCGLETSSIFFALLSIASTAPLVSVHRETRQNYGKNISDSAEETKKVHKLLQRPLSNFLTAEILQREASLVGF